MKLALSLGFSCLLSFQVFALPVGLSGSQGDLPCGVHTLMDISSGSGTWTTQVQFSNEIGEVILPNDSCKVITEKGHNVAGDTVQMVQSIPVTENMPQTVAQKLVSGENFYAVLIVTMTQQPPSSEENQALLYDNRLKRESLPLNANDIKPPYKRLLEENAVLERISDTGPPPKTCVFYIGAKGPAVPVQFATGFRGAECKISVDTSKYTYYLNAQ